MVTSFFSRGAGHIMDLIEYGVQIFGPKSVRRGRGSTNSGIRMRGGVEHRCMDANSTSNQDHRPVGNDIDAFHSSVFFLLAAYGRTNRMHDGMVGGATPKQVSE